MSDNNCKLDIQDLQPEMYWKIDRSFVEFDEFDGYEKVAEKFKKSLCTFQTDSKDSFYNAVIYGLIVKLSENKEANRNIVEQILGKEFFSEDIQKMKELLQYDISFCNFEKKCYAAKKILSKEKLFLRVYEQRNKFRYVNEKGVQGKNEVIQEL